MKRTIVIALIVACMVFGVVAYASAANPETVNVSVTPNAKLTMTIDTNAVDFGAMDPGTSKTLNNAVTLTVSSNKLWSLGKVVTDAAPINLTTSFANIAAQPRIGGRTIADSYTITNLPWALDGGTVANASVTYTATQP